MRETNVCCLKGNVQSSSATCPCTCVVLYLRPRVQLKDEDFWQRSSRDFQDWKEVLTWKFEIFSRLFETFSCRDFDREVREIFRRKTRVKHGPVSPRSPVRHTHTHKGWNKALVYPRTRAAHTQTQTHTHCMVYMFTICKNSRRMPPWRPGTPSCKHTNITRILSEYSSSQHKCEILKLINKIPLARTYPPIILCHSRLKQVKVLYYGGICAGQWKYLMLFANPSCTGTSISSI